MFAGNDNQIHLPLPTIKVPPSTPVHVAPATTPMQVQKNMPLPVIQVPPSTPMHMVSATVPMQVPVAVPIATMAPASLVAHSAVTAQPQPQTSVVVNMQSGGNQVYDYMAMGPRGGPMAFGPISWGSDLLSCYDDIPTCLWGCFCSCILPCYLSSMYGESCCFGWLPGAVCLLRAALRERYKIPGSLLNDYCTMCCCSICALCQMCREMKAREWHNSRVPMPWKI
ncbi:uncharacterized protein ACMZJ9_019273 isoform 1-T2 [Mantella aurantiaca]